jgi:hypothetical protein
LKLKTKRRELKLENDGWFRMTADLWTEPGRLNPKPKLLADVNFPDTLVEAFKKSGVNIRPAREMAVSHLSDADLLPRASTLGRLLITLDDDFWSEHKFPLHFSPGLIYVDSGRSFEGSVGMYLLIEFLKSFGGGWSGIKIRASSDKLVLKMRTIQGPRVEYEMRAFMGVGIFAREMSSSFKP